MLKLTLDITPEQLILIRELLWLTKLGDSNIFESAASDLAVELENSTDIVAALKSVYGSPRIETEYEDDSDYPTISIYAAE